MTLSRVTIIMPVYNAGKFVHSAIDSICRQSFAGFDLLVLDDGSTDDTASVVQSFTDPRIHYIKNDCNMGVAKTLNRGLDLAQSEFVVRMDADDICYPQRLARQVDFMEKNPAVGLSGSWVRYFGNQPPIVDRSPVGPEIVRAFLLFDNPLYHPSVILRKSCFDHYGLRYDPLYSRSEDYELWLRAAECFPIDNIPEPLIKFRCHGGSVTTTAAETMQNQTCQLLGGGLAKLGVAASDEELFFHFHIAKGHRTDSLHTLQKAQQWLVKLIAANETAKFYDQQAFAEVVGRIWFRLCSRSAQLGLVTWRLSLQAKLLGGYQPPMSSKLLFLLSLIANAVKKPELPSGGRGKP